MGCNSPKNSAGCVGNPANWLKCKGCPNIPAVAKFLGCELALGLGARILSIVNNELPELLFPTDGVVLAPLLKSRPMLAFCLKLPSPNNIADASKL